MDLLTIVSLMRHVMGSQCKRRQMLSNSSELASAITGASHLQKVLPNVEKAENPLYKLPLGSRM
jgi:hypothetical protein